MAAWGEGGRDEDGVAAEPAYEAQTGYVVNPLDGETVSVGPMLVTFKCTGGETGGGFALVEVTIPPYFADILPHQHHTSSEAIYLTQGMLAVTLGEETMVVRQGSFILVPPNTIHRVWNPAATQATFLTYYTPAGVEQLYAELAAHEWPTSAERRAELATLWAAGAGYDHYLVGDDDAQ